MAGSIRNDSCNQPTLKASSEKYAHLVHDSTTQLHQSLEPILTALDRRAMGLTKLANFESALHNANLIQQLSPSSAVGYLREAYVYSEQGKQHHVIAICNKGLDRVDTDDKHYVTLQQVKEDAEQRQNTRVDFMKQLPAEIVFETLIPMLLDNFLMSSTTPSPYLYVSNVWRDRIVQCFNGLHFEVGAKEKHNLSHVLELSQCIRKLYVGQGSNEGWFCDLLRNHDFCSLRELCIDYYSTKGVDPLLSCFKLIGNALTELVLDIHCMSIVSMADIMQSCPNMVSLDLTQPCVPDFSTLPMTAWPKLTSLCVKGTAGIMCFTHDDIHDIGKRFGSLKRLVFYPCFDKQITAVVLHYYPSMTRLEFLCQIDGAQRIYMAQGIPQKEIGIMDFYIEAGSMRGYVPWGILIDELRQQQNTIECIKCNLDLRETLHEREDHKEIYTIKYGRLKQLSLSKSGWWIPRNAPMLEELHIAAYIIKKNVAVLDTIPPKLKKLELDLDHDFDLRYKAPLERYIKRFALRSHLKELVIHFSSSDNIDTILNAIHCLDQLQRLLISFTTMWDYYQMQSFIDGLVKGCPKVACLEIQCENAPSTLSLNALKQLEHLERFAFSINDMDGDDGFWQGIQAISQLKCIRIYPASAANMDAIRRLQGQRRDMKIILDPRFTRFEDAL